MQMFIRCLNNGRTQAILTFWTFGSAAATGNFTFIVNTSSTYIFLRYPHHGLPHFVCTASDFLQIWSAFCYMMPSRPLSNSWTASSGAISSQKSPCLKKCIKFMWSAIRTEQNMSKILLSSQRSGQCAHHMWLTMQHAAPWQKIASKMYYWPWWSKIGYQNVLMTAQILKNGQTGRNNSNHVTLFSPIKLQEYSICMHNIFNIILFIFLSVSKHTAYSKVFSILQMFEVQCRRTTNG